jgi:hypothetical protein
MRSTSQASTKKSFPSPSVTVCHALPKACLSCPQTKLSTKSLPHSHPQSPSVTSVTSVRCSSPDAYLSRPEANAVTKSLPHSHPQSPSVTSVTSVRCSSPMRVFPTRKPMLSTINNYPINNSAISPIDKPFIIGSSLSTVDWIMARFFCWRLSIFSSTVARAINL